MQAPKKENTKPTKEDQSYWEMMIDGIVRPPRAKYHEAQLGSAKLIQEARLFATRVNCF